MTDRPVPAYFEDWRSVITAEDRAVYAAAGYGGRLPVGSRPALLVIDATYAFVGIRDVPLEASMEAYPNSCGPVAWAAVAVIAELASRFREAGHPVIYTAGLPHHQRLPGLWEVKNTSLPRPRANEVVDEIAPMPGDVVLRKTKPSAFHATPLVEYLIGAAVDCVVVCGGTTSGCVRATVIDAFSHNFPVTVVEDAVFDRGGLSHAVNLFDMDEKYADVTTSATVIERLDEAAAGAGQGTAPQGR